MATQNRFITALFCLSLLSGCKSSSAEVSGTVTYKGKPVPNGYITFFPEGGDGNTFGAPIIAGKYEVKDAVPGRRRVLITAHAEFKGDKASAKRLDFLPFEKIPADAKANNQIHEITAGQQILNFDL